LQSLFCLHCFCTLAVKSSEVEKEMEQVNIKPNVDIRLSDLKLVLGPELRIVYPLILNFAVSGELELNGLAHPKRIEPKGILTFENGDVNLVATQVSPMFSSL
jgi:septum formation inhibitor-activating ATPase MinD